MKRIVIIGFYGALIGIVIGIAVVCGMWLVSDNFGNFRDSEYLQAVALNKLGRLRANVGDTYYAKALRIDPYNIETSATATIRLGKEAEIVYGYIQVENINRAIKFFSSINKLRTKWDILFQLENISKHNIEQKLPLANKTIEFIKTVMPAGENEKRRDLLILLGNDFLEIENKEKAKIAFNEAAELHNKIRQDEETNKNRETPESASYNNISQAREASVDAVAMDDSRQISINLGKIIIFPLLFGAVGFILSVILKPALEAYGRSIIAPAIAKKIGSNEMMKELNLNK